MAKVPQLLEHIIPEHYRISLDVDMERFRFDGVEEITFELVGATHELVFHALELEIAEATIESGAAADKITYDVAAQTATLVFSDRVPGGGHKVKLRYSGTIDDTLHGFYRSKYLQGGEEKWLATTQFEAIHARQAFVCVDEPSAKAVFELTLVVPQELTAIANTNVVSEAPAGAGRKEVKFAPTPRMSSYLAAWVVGELEYVETKTAEGVVVRAYATPGRAQQLTYAAEVAARTLSFYNDYFGIPYPLPKLDMMAVPDFAAGAMENWGLVTYRETALLLDPNKTSLLSKQWVTKVVAHELAHQWFGDLVTMRWWDDLWLNEGFASWMENFAQDNLFPEWKVWTEFVSGDVSYSMGMDGLANTHPIQVEVEDPIHLDEIFDAVSYQKGSSIINMLHHYLGGKAFREGLQQYLKAHAYHNSETHDLWRAFSKASGKPVDELMVAWTSQPGFPLMWFDEGKLWQRRFFSSPREAAKAKHAKTSRWLIPFSVLLPDGHETEQTLLGRASGPLPDEIMAADWFKPNPGQTVFYRTHYTQGMIEALLPPLRKRTLTATDRFGVIDDVFATTAAGLTDSGVALKLVEAMREEPDYVVWGAIAGGFANILAITEDEALRRRLEAFGRWLVEPNLARLGWEAKADEPVFDALMRPMIIQLAIHFEHEGVIAEAKRRFATYMARGEIDPDLRFVILFGAARHGGETEFDTILEHYRTEQVPQVKMSFLTALCRFRTPQLIDRFLTFGLSEDVRPQDLYMVVAHGSRNRASREATWEWLKANWDIMLERYGAGGHMLEHFPLYVGSGFSSHEMAADMRAFFTKYANPTTDRPAAQAIEGVELRADWYDRDQRSITDFMSQWEANQK